MILYVISGFFSYIPDLKFDFVYKWLFSRFSLDGRKGKGPAGTIPHSRTSYERAFFQLEKEIVHATSAYHFPVSFKFGKIRDCRRMKKIQCRPIIL